MISEREEDLDAEDTTAQAGWLYTDLLLALMVIFLATITFVPAQINPNPSGSEQSASNVISPFKNTDNSLTILVKSEIDVDLATKVQEYFLKNKDLSNKQVSILQVVGGYDPKTGSEADGMLTAISYAGKLRSKNPALIGTARSTISSSSLVASGQALVRLTFE